MDHSHAHIMEYANDRPNETKIMESTFSHQDKIESLAKSESLMHNKEQHEQHTYYKKIGKIILKYDAVILFGPTDAKKELYNIISQDARFADIKIETADAARMTENQEHAFVNDYFSKDKRHK